MGFIFAGKFSGQWLAAAMGLSVTASLITVMVAGQGSMLLGASSADRTEPVVYDELDAIQSCRKHSQEKFENTIVRSYVDDHSTRFEEDRGVYLVVLNSHIGTARKYDEATVYCYVRPTTNRVTYFRAYDSEKRSLQSGMGFDAFKNIFKSK